MQQLAQAILTADASVARDSFFPVQAYEQVKAIKDPKRDFDRRLWANFERDIHEYHKALKGPESASESATFVSISVPENRIEWMKPRSEGNRLGYFRARHAKLLFRAPNGKEHTLDLTSLISWRGEWYVIHLHGFE
jgi:hypothetical protein